jgi:hypothetical protein
MSEGVKVRTDGAFPGRQGWRIGIRCDKNSRVPGEPVFGLWWPFPRGVPRRDREARHATCKANPRSAS